jgi:1-deoxy-D-xylulose-5-phosphate reductoisomerase
LGSTGSIGRSALEVVRQYPGLFSIEVLAAHSNVELIAAQIREFRPSVAALSDPEAARRLRDMNLGVRVLEGPQGLEEAATVPVDVCLCAVVGAAGLGPLMAAIDAGNRIALANKESLVMAGGLVMERASERGVPILPVDSEHNAIFQCLHGHKLSEVHCVHITASGGPFYGRSKSSLSQVTPDEACHHPTWNMGAKISVDSATLMNKGLEVIEAMWLFGLPLEKIAVLIHPQSVIHSLVEFNDGGILGHLGVTDMKFPILFALTWPERVESPMARLDLTAVSKLTFAAPDFSKSPCLALALNAAAAGGTAPAILNAANEVAVSAFCDRRIGFLDIEHVVKAVCEDMTIVEADCMPAIMAADAAARKKAEIIVKSLSR